METKKALRIRRISVEVDGGSTGTKIISLNPGDNVGLFPTRTNAGEMLLVVRALLNVSGFVDSKQVCPI